MLLMGRKALVTGASSGIGKATAERLGGEGAGVCVNYYSEKERAVAEEVVAAIEQAGPQAIAIRADVGDENDVKRMVAQTVSELGGLDLHVNNAGIEKQVPLLEMSLEDWDAVLRTNLTGSFLCLREAGKVMAETRRRGNRQHLERPRVHPLAGFRPLLREQGGAEDADGHRRPRARQQEDSFPIGRTGEPDEIAAAVAWLASDEARYITGTSVVVDGGMSLYPRFV